MDTLLFSQNTRRTGNNAAETSQAFHVKLFERFTDPNLLKPLKLNMHSVSLKTGNTGLTVLFSSVVMVGGDESSRQRSG